MKKYITQKNIIILTLTIVVLILVYKSCKFVPKAIQSITKKELVKKVDSTIKQEVKIEDKLQEVKQIENKVEKTYKESKNTLEEKLLYYPEYIYLTDTITKEIDTALIIEQYKKLIVGTKDFIVKVDSVVNIKDTIISLLESKIENKEYQLVLKDHKLFGLESLNKKQKAIIKRKNAKLWLYRIGVGVAGYYIIKKNL